MQELRLVLIIVGALMISALLLHGLWTSRKEKPTKFGDKPKPVGKLDGQKSLDNEGFDQDGVGAVRVKGSESEEPTPYFQSEPVKTGSVNFGEKIDADPLLDTPTPTVNRHETTDLPAMSAKPAPEFTHVAPQPEVATAPQAAENPFAQPAEASVVQQPAPVQQQVTPEVAVQSQAAVAQPTVSQPVPKTNKDNEPGLGNLDIVTGSSDVVKQEPIETNPSQHLAQPVMATSTSVDASQDAVAEPALDTNTVIVSETEITSQPAPQQDMKMPEQASQPSPEPVIEERSSQESHVQESAVQEHRVEDAIIEEKVESPVEPEVVAPEPAPLERSYIALNIHARNGELLRGVKLFNSLEQNGLIFGENSVYHRHADKAGLEPVIFTVTNMVQPGNFPQQDIENFETPGIAFYLMLPCHGRADLNFNMMLQTVQQIADELSADVLDQDRNMITPYRISEYREKAKFYTQA
ncbi:cell division protein ZipA [Photobacterium swingsii]|uniref:cell division protein ZipA n=1 Tax=Photobacterium swingsii TaxID=680026 RepID=UPI0040685518